MTRGMLLTVGRGLTSSPFVLPPATPKERVEIIKDAFRRAWHDAKFAKKFE